MDFLIAVLAGISFSLSSTVMFFSLIHNAKNSIIKAYVYFIPCSSTILTLPSALLLILRVLECKKHTLYLLTGLMICIILIVTLYALMSNFDRTYIKGLYPAEVIYFGAPWYYILVCATTSGVSISVLLGWFLYIIRISVM